MLQNDVASKLQNGVFFLRTVSFDNVFVYKHGFFGQPIIIFCPFIFTTSLFCLCLLSNVKKKLQFQV